MTTDRATDQPHKEVTMTKRLVLVALVVAAALVLAAPALAFDGYRDTYTPSFGGTGTCQGCHSLYPEFTNYKSTAHALVGEAIVDPVTGELVGGTPNAEPIADGPGCAGCHSGNYDPKKHVPLADPIPDDDIDPAYPSTNTLLGDDAFSEPFVGCSTCHVGFEETHAFVGGSPKSNLANAAICGQCHSRYSNSVVKYENYDGTFSTQQYTLGNFSPLGTAANGWTPEPITDYLNVPTRDAPQQMVFYKDPDGNVLPYPDDPAEAETETRAWNARAHANGAQQYDEWAMEGHASALDDLINEMGGRQPFLTPCLECHSADYRLAEEAGDPTPTIADAKYGVTCQVCHDPHTQSTQDTLWNVNAEPRNPQLTAPRQDLCVECHNAELDGKTATPGSAVHHPMKEMMDGTGAIGVPQGTPSVHKGKCVDCHMVPTAWTREGAANGANHVFAIVEPDVAANSISSGKINVNGVSDYQSLPYSSCSECHGRSSDPYATYLSGTFENRQYQMEKVWDPEITAELKSAAARMGYASTAAANTAINKKAQADWTASELAFQSAYTNQTYIESEGSWGIHNWEYAKSIALKAIDQAKSVKTTLKDITIDQSPAPYTTPKTTTYGQSVVISGKVVGGTPDALLGGTVVLWAKPASGTKFTPVASTYLYGDNVDMYRFSAMPSELTTYKVQFAGNASYEAFVSAATLDIQVKWKLTIKSSLSKPKLNAKVTFSGTVGPAMAGTVTIEKAKAGGAYKKVTTATVDAAGNYSRQVKMTSKGTWYFHITFPADATHLSNKSAYVKVVVK
jgi:Doubled CXXCH motif (Paired_CXXCH_1)